MSLARILIVGANAAGLAVVRGLRDGGYEGRIQVFDRDADALVQRPPLSKAVLLGEAAPPLLSPTDLAALDVELELGVEVTAIDVAARRLATRMGVVDGDALVLCTGASPRQLPGLALSERVHVLRTRAEADRLRAALKPGVRLLVAGAGLIGLETAAAARTLGVDVVVIETAPAPLARVLPLEIAAPVIETHRARGVRVLTGVSIVDAAEDAGLRVTLSNGQRLAADHLLVSIGAAPNVGLARAAGLGDAAGVAVDGRGQTLAPAVFAAGDVARLPTTDGRRRFENLQHAEAHGRHVAGAVLGRPEAYRALEWFWSDQYDLNIQALGDRTGSPDVLRRSSDGGVLALWTRDGGLVGAAGINAGGMIAASKRLILRGARLDLDVLATGDLAQLARRPAA